MLCIQIHPQRNAVVRMDHVCSCVRCACDVPSRLSLSISLVRSLSAAFSFVPSSTCVYSWDDARWCIDTRIIYRYRLASTFTALDLECSLIPSTESSLMLLLLLLSSLLVFHIWIFNGGFNINCILFHYYWWRWSFTTHPFILICFADFLSFFLAPSLSLSHTHLHRVELVIRLWSIAFAQTHKIQRDLI